MNDLPRRLVGRARREAERAGPLVTAVRQDHRSQQARKALERARMMARTRRASPDEVLDQIVESALRDGLVRNPASPEAR